MQRPSDPLGILGEKKKGKSERDKDMHLGIICDVENLNPPKYTILGNDTAI